MNDPTTRQKVLDDALRIVSSDRNKEYGEPEDNFSRIAALWEAFQGRQFTSTDVAIMMALVKVARIATSPGKLDHYVDLAGYAACAAEVAWAD